MKISILTVYNSENCGSFWQAYALAKTLDEMGHDISFYRRKTKGSSHSYFLLFARICKYLLQGEVATVRNLWKQHWAFEKMQRIFHTISEVGNTEAFVIGSDTLWGVDLKYLLDNFDLYTGARFPNIKSITYAVSVGNAKDEHFAKCKNIENNLKRLSAISVRDSSTESFVKRYSGREVTKVLDPTLLLDAEEYPKQKDFSEKNPYILIYTFKPISDVAMKNLSCFAKKKGLEIIVYGRRTKWKNSRYASPESFISYFSNADYVITDTFHGTIFSMIFHRIFAVLDRNKSKVIELLEQFDYMDRLVHDEINVLDVLEEPISFTQFEIIKNTSRKVSKEYLIHALD